MNAWNVVFYLSWIGIVKIYDWLKRCILEVDRLRANPVVEKEK